MQLPPDLAPMPTAEDFLPFVGGLLRVEATPEAIELTLESVDRRRKEDWMPREPFSLLLSTPRDVLVSEGLYCLQPTGGRAFDLYMMPIASPPGDRQFYQVVVN